MFDTIENICRLCLETGTLIPIFDSNQLSYLIMSCTSVEIHEHDGLPNLMCTECLTQLELVVSFRQKVEQSDKSLREYLSAREDETTKSPQTCDDHDFASNKATGDFKEKQKESHNIKRSNHSPKANNRKKDVIPKKRGRKKLSINQELNNVDKTSLNISNLIVTSDDLPNVNCTREKRVRDNTRKHMCDTCGKTFIYLSNLVDHCRIHTGDKPFICTVCGSRFAQTGHLMIHARTHSGVKPYKCDVCSRAFTVSHALKKHLRIHTGERPYSCSVCNKTFVTSYHLTNHFKRHTGEKNFKCDWPGCTLGFVNISEMKRHRVRHEKIGDTSKSKNDVPVTNYETVINPVVYSNNGQINQYPVKVILNEKDEL